MKIPSNTPLIAEEEIEVVTDVLRTGMLTSSDIHGGTYVRKFEELSSTFVKSKFSVAVNSGTSALQAALLALGVKDGDEVLLPSFTFVATANAVASTGAKPVFVDIQKDKYTMDPLDMQRKITKRSRAIIPVHLYGGIAEINEILEIAQRNDLRVIEDAAQSLGSTLNGKHTGTFGDIGCYSLYPSKIITSGEGGFVVTDNKKLSDNLQMIRNHGMAQNHNVSILGLNLRMPEISAAIATVQMQKLTKFLGLRRKNAKHLSDLLDCCSNITIPQEGNGECVNWSLYTIASKERDHIKKELESNNFGAAIYYPTPIHKMPYYNNQVNLPITDFAAKRVLSIPVHPGVTTENIDKMAKLIQHITN